TSSRPAAVTRLLESIRCKEFVMAMRPVHFCGPPVRLRDFAVRSTRKSSTEQVRGLTGGVPFPERDRAAPAFVHGLFEGPESLRSVLRLVAFEGAFEVLEILGRIRNRHRQIGGIDGVEWQGRGPDGVEWLGLRGRKSRIVEFDAGTV